ncbi:MAG: HlyD family efflux transporter periplasmic adaptor subunit [Planctomycetota bacterium]|nr:HlyD family efflux transporter periplasmic adaptor subunit [Planctomycetota bacterium]
MSTSPQKKTHVLPIVIVLVAAAGFAWAGWRDDGWFRTEVVAEANGWVAKRGRLDVSVVQSGNLSARNSAKVFSEVEGRNAILEIVEEGSFVNEGDVIVQLDVAQLLERKVAQDIALQNAQAALTTAEQRLAIQHSQNASDIAQAEQKLEFAKTDLTKYEEGNWPNDQAAAKEAITKAEMELTQAQERLYWSEKLNKEDYITRTELETDQLNHNNAAIRLEQSIRNQDLLERFDNPKEMARLGGAVAEAERELERVNLQAAARLVDIDADVRTSRAKAQLESQKFTKYVDQLVKATIRAPVSGYVVYKRTDSWRGSGDIIQKGSEVQERQEILAIPQAGGMIAEVSLHESVVRKVQPGMQVKIKASALPGKEFNGDVQSVALVPDSGSMWTNPNLRQFKTQISIRDASADARPGMSCSVEILVETIEDALSVPVQAIHRSGGATICFVGGKPRIVEVGASSEAWVEILTGLEAGEIVALNPPTGFKPEPEPESENPAPKMEGIPSGAAMPDRSGASGAGRERPQGGTGSPGGSRPPRSGGSGPNPGAGEHGSGS